MTFTCQHCAWCCRNLPIAVSASDLARWFNSGRNDVLREVSWINNYPKPNTGGFYIAKTTFNPKQPCPFLIERNLCGIHETKPRCCRDYPQANIGKGECPAATDFVDKQAKKEQRRDYLSAFENRNSFLRLLTIARRELSNG